MDHETRSEPGRLVETTSEIFVGEWQRLVSTTNWEKGRIIHERRQALVESQAPVQVYSDEAWTRRVGGVSSQHVGRLRRVHERFADSRGHYPALYWSHFQAALDWNDAELWLEGARLEGWSVSQMRGQRWEAQGAPDELKPRDEDIVSTEMDEDFHSELGGSDVDQSPASEPFETVSHVEAADEAPVEQVEYESPVAEAAHPAMAPLAGFSNLPDDLLEAFEGCKLAIVRHRLAGWAEVSCDTVIAALDALADLARAPVEV